MDHKMVKKILNHYQTPLYCFDIRRLKDRIHYFRSVFPENVRLCYAAKANTFILKEITEDVDFYEICSPGEMDICERLNIPKQKIVLSGVYKEKKDLQRLIEHDDETAVYTVESLQQLLMLVEISLNCQRLIHVIIRLSSGNQFGVDQECLRYIIENRQHYPYLHIKGIQYFSGTQKHSLQRIKKEITMLTDLISELQQLYQFETEVLEYGPGLPVDYFLGSHFDEEPYLEGFSQLLRQLNPKMEIVLEIGRSLAACCGYYLTKVVDVKTNRDENYAIVDGGIHHLVYYGQSMAMKTPQYELIRDHEEIAHDQLPEKWNICGSLCTINDILIKQLAVNELKIDDIFVFANTGAYCPTEGISLFLTRDLPDIVLIKDEYLQSVRLSKKTSFFNQPYYTDL